MVVWVFLKNQKFYSDFKIEQFTFAASQILWRKNTSEKIVLKNRVF
jgi:hypothetical protein